MSCSSDEDLGLDWVPYSKRREWADVTPLEQDDGPNPIVAIAYSDKFRDVYDYFRAVLALNEKSERSLLLTKDALKLNPANYTVWQYRREILYALEKDLNEELDYLDNVITENPKNYQVWHHRQIIAKKLNDPSRELSLTEAVLNMDAKNYHAWQYRQWAIKTFNLYDNELSYVDRLISADVRNNSAWNQRFFVLKHFGFTPDVIERELQYTMNRIRFVKNNESSWNFLRGILQEAEGGLSSHPEVIEFSEELYESGIRSPFLLGFLVDWYSEKCLQCTDAQEKEILARKVYQMCDSLSREHDVIRRKYWQYIAGRLTIKLTA